MHASFMREDAEIRYGGKQILMRACRQNGPSMFVIESGFRLRFIAISLHLINGRSRVLSRGRD